MTASCALGTQTVIAFNISLGLKPQDQCLRRIDVGVDGGGLAVDQPVQKVQHVGLGRHACREGHFHGHQHSLLVVLKDKSEEIDHVAITAWPSQHLLLQLPEGERQFCKGRAIA
jgi:hypothetical protein